MVYSQKLYNSADVHRGNCIMTVLNCSSLTTHAHFWSISSLIAVAVKWLVTVNEIQHASWAAEHACVVWWTYMHSGWRTAKESREMLQQHVTLSQQQTRRWGEQVSSRHLQARGNTREWQGTSIISINVHCKKTPGGFVVEATVTSSGCKTYFVCYSMSFIQRKILIY